MSQPLHILVLAAGQGKRMHSRRPKVLQPLAGKPLLAHVLDIARALEPMAVHVIYGHGGDAVRAEFTDQAGVCWAHQAEQGGTGHAVQVGMTGIPDSAQVLVLMGDAPLIRSQSLMDLLAESGSGIGILTAVLPDPHGYGRILRDADGRVMRIVEECDADDEQRGIGEINSGILCAPAADLRRWLDRIERDNAQGELYLTDVVGLAVADGQAVVGSLAADHVEVLGANNRRQLARLERLYQNRRAGELCDLGAVVIDPARVDVRGEIRVGEDVVIDINTVFEGDNQLADSVHIGPHCLIRNCDLGPGTRVHSHCVLDGVRTDGDCDIGPFARLRPGTELASATRVGNFVETKNARIGVGSKAGHLSYLGDTTLGENVNIGAGTITCNYDGVNKYHTVIGDGAFIGSGTQLIAPVEVKQGATIGAGSTITKTAPKDELTLSRARQTTIKGWHKPKKKQ
jgi:bifunctional UDP-N-acetylglucosamine pyrophosphorylase/glucosamine-1-phosphate N-acetyltransferase